MGKHLVCTDLHGCGRLWDKIKEKLNDDDELYFLGDATDRGPDGVRIMLELLTDERVTYLRGNHEVFIQDFLSYAVKVDDWERIPNSVKDLWEGNGGSKTMDDLWFDFSKEELEAIYGILMDLDNSTAVIVNGTKFLLSHAGYTPRHLFQDLMDDPQVLLWNRAHFPDNWIEEKDGEDVIVLHGHTPTAFLKEFEFADGETMMTFDRYPEITDEECKFLKPVVYAGGHKVDLDLGSAFSNRVALYCMETKTWEILDINDELIDF